VAAAASIRIAFNDIPNFAPVAALSLFAGCFFESLLIAFLAPVLVMVISDSVIGTYEPLLMVAVYGTLTAPVFCRSLVRRSVRPSESGYSVWMSVLTLIGCSLGASILFFLVTNFVVWFYWYEASVTGIATCYWNALPFFRYTVAGDLIFATVLLGSYAFIHHRVIAKDLSFSKAQLANTEL
jgi:hypothetical protein